MNENGQVPGRSVNMITLAPSAFSAATPQACVQDAGRHLKWIRGAITLACCAMLVAVAGEAQGETVRVFPLDANQVAESASDSTATGCAQATLNAEQTQVTFYIEHDVANPTKAFVGFAPQGNFGATQFTFNSAVSPIEGTWDIPAGLVDEFIGNPPFLYVRIDSAARPNGDIRGQIVDSTCTFENGGEGEGEAEGEGEDPPVQDPCGGCQGLKDGERTVQNLFNAFWPFLVLLLGFSAWNRRRDRQP